MVLVILRDDLSRFYWFFAVAGVKTSRCCFLGFYHFQERLNLGSLSHYNQCCVHCPFNKRCVLASTAASCRTSPLLCHSLASFTASKAGSGLLGSPPFQKELTFCEKYDNYRYFPWLAISDIYSKLL
jgi:hypothetical protein